MNIVLASSVRNDPTLSIAILQRALRTEYLALGQEATCLYKDDLGVRFDRINEIEFSLKCAFIASLTKADVLDFKVGDGLYSALRSKMNRRTRSQIVVARSHGLDFINYRIKRRYARETGLHMSWRERLYFGGYLLWQVHNHMRLADLCLFLNQEEHDYAIERLAIDPNKCIVVDNGIPDHMIGLPEPQRRQGSSVRIAVLGSYGVRKINVSPKALNVILQRHPSVTVDFLGTGVADDRVLADYASSLHDRITNVTTYDHATLSSLLRRYDVLFSPSMAEGFSLSVLEAMACGLAIVSSDLSYLTDRLQADSEAVFFERLNADAMIEALHRVICDSTLRDTLRHEGYRRAQHYSWRRIASDMMSLYTSHLDRLTAARRGHVGR